MGIIDSSTKQFKSKIHKENNLWICEIDHRGARKHNTLGKKNPQKGFWTILYIRNDHLQHFVNGNANGMLNGVNCNNEYSLSKIM